MRAPASKIYSQARASHSPMRGGPMETRLVLVEAKDDEEHNGGAGVKQDHVEEGRYTFKTFDPKFVTNPDRDSE